MNDIDLAAFLVGTILALAWQLTRKSYWELHTPRFAYRWLRNAGLRKSRFIRRARFVLSKRIKWLPLYFVVWSPALLVGWSLAFWLLPGTSWHWGLVGIAGSYWFFFGFMVLAGRTRAWKHQMAQYAAMQAAGRLELEEASDMLLEASRCTTPIVREAAIAGLCALGSQPALARVAQMQADDAEESVRAAASEALAKLLDSHADAEQVKSLAQLPDLCALHAEILGRLFRLIAASERREDWEALYQHESEISSIVDSQLHLRHAFPALYCRRCFARAVEGGYAHWRWVSCRSCKEAKDLQVDVQQVVGQIGGARDWLLQEGILRLNIWDDAHRKILPAELDIVEFLGGGSVNYDWAANALLDMLESRKHLNLPPPKVRFFGPVTLEMNTLLLLRSKGMQT